MEETLKGIRLLLADEGTADGHKEVPTLVALLLLREQQEATPPPPPKSMDAIFRPGEHAITADAACKSLIKAAPALLEAWLFYQEHKGTAK